MSARRRHGTDEEDLSEGEEGKAELGQFLKIFKFFFHNFFLFGFSGCMIDRACIVRDKKEASIFVKI